ncbi:MAG TPA: hypothetical protein VFE05_24450 [Longimicrobiaceae bacterium]|jgi:hypothetical protein|nr:hypothetical protein [Longimicrobiaceae bacterium]
MSDLPTPPDGGSGLPARRLSAQQLEAVIRRAVELQSGPGAADEGTSEAEVVRIGRELGLAPDVVRRAIGEVRAQVPAETGVMAKVMGPGVIRAARTIRKPAAPTGLHVERYLIECEYMVVQRRFPDRTRYVRASGAAAAVGRAMSRVGARHQQLQVRELDVAVSYVDDDSCLIELSTSMTGARAGMAAGGLAVGTASGGMVGLATVIALHAAAPLLLVGLPVTAAVMYGMKVGYGSMVERTHTEMEALLDRLERGELKVPPPTDWRRKLGI